MDNIFFKNENFFQIPKNHNDLNVKLKDYFNNLELTQDKVKEFLRKESDKKVNNSLNQDLIKNIFFKLGKTESSPENQDDIINIFWSLITDILSNENKIEKNEFLTNKFDIKLNRKFNKFGNDNILKFLGYKIVGLKEKNLNIKKFKLINDIIDIHDCNSFENKNDIIRKFDNNIKEIKNFENEICLLKDNIKDFKNIIENYDRGDIDVSANILNYPYNDTDKLKKVLFTWKNERDFIINLNEFQIFDLIEVSILKNYFYKKIKITNKFLNNLPQIIYFKYISINNKRFWTNYKIKDNISKRRHNMIEYYLENCENFINFKEFSNNSLSIRLSNNTINILTKVFYNSDYKLLENLKNENEEFNSFFKYYEDYSSIKENIMIREESLKPFLMIYKEYFDYFKESLIKDSNKFNYLDIFNININEILFKNKIINKYNIYEDAFNDKFENNFLFFNNYFTLKFNNYNRFFNYNDWDNLKYISKVNDLENLINIERENLNIDNKEDNNYMKKILYKSDWLKFYPCFYFPKISKGGLQEKPNLNKRKYHNYITNWVNILLESNINTVNEELDLKIKKFSKSDEIIENKIYSMTEKIYLNCYQMIYIDSRKYLILIQSYCNFYRSLQRNMNMMNYYINNLNEDEIKENSINDLIITKDDEFELNLSKLFQNEEYEFLDNTNPMNNQSYNPNTKFKGKFKIKEPFKDKYEFVNFEDNGKEFLKTYSLWDSEIVYQSGLYDFTQHLKYLSDILICFIENNLIEYNVDFKDLYNDNENLFTNQNLLINISKIPDLINFEYLYMKLLKLDQKYNYIKCKILMKFYKILNKVSDSKYYIKFCEFIFDFIVKKPEIIYKQRKFGINNFMNYLKNNQSFDSKDFNKQIIIYLNTIFENYEASIKNLNKYFELVKNIINNFKSNYNYFKEELKIENINFELDYSYVIKILLNIEEKKKYIKNNLMIDDNIGEINFTEFLFEKYWNNKLNKKINNYKKNNLEDDENFISIKNNLNFIKYFLDINSCTILSFKNILLDILINDEIIFFIDQIYINYCFSFDMQEIINNQKKIKGSILKNFENFKIIKNNELQVKSKGSINEENSIDKFNKLNKIIYLYYTQELRNNVEIYLCTLDINIICMSYQQKIYNNSWGKKFSFNFENKDKKGFNKININTENIFKNLMKCEHYGFHNIFELFKNDLFEITLFKEESVNNFLQYLKYTSDYLILINNFVELVLNNNVFNHLIFFNQIISQLRKNLCSENLINSYITQLNFANNLNNSNKKFEEFLLDINKYGSVIYEKILLDFFDYKINIILYDPIHFIKDILNIIHWDFKEEKLSLYYDKNKYKNIKNINNVDNISPNFTIINSEINIEYNNYKNINYNDIRKDIILKLRRVVLYLNMVYETNFDNRTIHKFFKLINFNQNQTFKISLIEELNLSNIKNTIINILTNNLINDKYKTNKKKNEEILNNYDEIVNINDTPNVLKFRNIYEIDIKKIWSRKLEKFEYNYIKNINFINIKKSNFKKNQEKKVTHNKIFNIEEKSKKSLNFVEKFFEQIIYHINKFYHNNIYQINKSSINLIELDKILDNLKDIKFKMNNLNNDFPKDYGFSKIQNINYNKIETKDIFLEINDIEVPFFLNDTILYDYCVNLKYVLSFFNLMFYQHSLELNNEDFFCLYNMEIPFYILGHLKIKEIENEFKDKDFKMRNFNEDILFKRNKKIENSELIKEYEDFEELSKIRFYICDIKKLELKFLNQFKEINKFFEEINSNLSKIKENPKILKPKNVFNSLLKYSNDNLQKTIILANFDILFKIRWNNITKDIVDIAKGLENTDNFKNIRNIFLEIMFPDLNKTMNKNNKKDFARKFSKRNFGNKDYEKIKKIIKSNKMINIMINWVNKKSVNSKSYNLFNYYNSRMDWEFIFLNNINLTYKEKSILNNKIFEIKINLDIANTSTINKKNTSIIENNIFLNQILNLNIKNIILLEILTNVYNYVNPNHMKDIFNNIIELKDEDKGAKYDLNLLKIIINSKIKNYDTEKYNNYSILNFKELIQKYKDSNIFKKLFNSEDDIQYIYDKININNDSTIINIINEEFEFIENKKLKKFDDHKEILIKTISWNLKNSFLNYELTTNNYLLFFTCQELFKNLLNFELDKFNKKKENIYMNNILVNAEYPYLDKFLSEFVNSSYFIEFNNKEKFFIISKNDFIDIISKLNDLNNFETYDILGDKLDLEIEKINKNMHKKELVNFYWNILIINFKKKINSQIGLKNLNFIEEIESLNNSLKLQNYDNKHLFSKLSVVFKYKFNQDISELERNYNLVNDKLNEFKNKIKVDIAKIIEKGKNDSLKKLKKKYEEIFDDNYPINNKKTKLFLTEINETIKLNIDSDNGEEIINLAIKNAIESCIKLKAFYCLKKFKNMNRIMKKWENFKKKSNDIEILNKLIQEKEREENSLKNEFKNIQKKIAKLEIENNILRKDLNKNEFEKIDLMKIVNVKKSKIEELEWNEKVKLINKNTQTSNINNKLININISKGIKNCLAVESNLLTKKILKDNKNFIDNKIIADNISDNRINEIKEKFEQKKNLEISQYSKPQSSKTRISSALRPLSKFKKK